MAGIIEKAIEAEPQERLYGNGLKLEFATEKEKGQDKIFFEYMDLKNTYESIKNCLIYINSFPFSPKVSKVEYLKFIYSAYLNEIYILQTRICKLTKTINRCLKAYKNDEDFKSDYDKLEKATKVASKFFKSLIVVRGDHVHKKRYDTMEMNKVSGYEYVSNTDFKKSKEIKKIAILSTELLKLEYKERLEENNKNINTIINHYIGSVKEFLFNKGYMDKVAYYQERG